MTTCDVAIVGAGPYGLAASAHVKQLKGLDVRAAIVLLRGTDFAARNLARRIAEETKS